MKLTSRIHQNWSYRVVGERFKTFGITPLSQAILYCNATYFSSKGDWASGGSPSPGVQDESLQLGALSL